MNSAQRALKAARHEEAAGHLTRYGPDAVIAEHAAPLSPRVVAQLRDLLNFLLFAATGLNLAIGEPCRDLARHRGKYLRRGAGDQS
ncbi:hypothetical protein [Streptomyces griseorubiginosus]|uniref:hypothetical protein n=1 Tax=Streptomyces griseorubiginosus TaxID=67304 RepID=UPI002E816E10|nr:hypothetical protein [Streptomyces griseorubiginosus]WUB42624.1 hypothetical protein OHN19_04445 [Streptomyces griseorubiginosus]WUB51142.1 hypothetical protein OG942_04440 [Streptomyces griseorubiginosus]